MTDLFEAANQLEAGWPLARRMRPESLADIVGQEHLTAPGKPLAALLAALSEPDHVVRAPSMILWGPAGCGKTTLAGVIAAHVGDGFEQLSAISAGVKELRAIIARAKQHLATRGVRLVLFLDEIHRFSKAQQDALLPAVEDGWVILIAATTENPSFALIKPLISRSLVLPIHRLGSADLETLVHRAVASPRGLAHQVSIDSSACAQLIRLAGGDARRTLTLLEGAATLALGGADRPAQISVAHVEATCSEATVAYDKTGDQHYDVTSALIKSIRGSDVDAALHYLAVMVAAGEDVAFICRRLMISAAEDIGLADPQALTIATSGYTAVTAIGLPEARIILGQVVVYLALAPKSNASYAAINASLADVQAGRGGVPPMWLRDSHYAGAEDLGHGVGYQYAHDDEHGVVTQQYPPDDLVGVEYYHPTVRGAEGNWHARLAALRRRVRGTE